MTMLRPGWSVLSFVLLLVLITGAATAGRAQDAPSLVANATSPVVATQPPPTTTAPAAPAPTAATAPAADADAGQLDEVSQRAEQLSLQARRARSDVSLVGLRASAAATQAKAEALAALHARELVSIEGRLRVLSGPKGEERAGLSPAERLERERLTHRRDLLQRQLARAKTAAGAASETYTRVSDQRRTDFDAKLLARTASPLEAGFWTGLAAAVEPDSRRVTALAAEAWRSALAAAEPRAASAILISLIVAALVAWPLRRFLLRSVQRRDTVENTPRQGLRRSAHALTIVLINTALPALAAACVNLGLTWGDVLSAQAQELVQALMIAVIWGAAVLALARQLAGEGERGEGLVAVPRRLARRMRALPWLVVTITGAGFLLSRLNSVVGASLAATIASNCVVSLAYAGVASLVLVALGADREDEADAQPPSAGRALLSVGLSLAVALTIAAVFAGYTTFAAVISSQVFWISILTAASWLLLRFTEEFCTFLFAPDGWIGRVLTGVVNLRGRTSEQLGALTSLVLQILVVLAALGLAITPFGRNGDVLTPHFDGFGRSLRLGSLVVSPKAVGIGLAILLGGLMLAHFAQRWVDRRFLPLTDWDAGVRNSVSTGVRYLALGAAILWSLAAAGVGFKQVAIVAGALSVGIGFGLQQIVQNFVSGLILLVERPVKVGDWVNVGGLEGDIRRIRVRATEIGLFDRSTLIVPNSDLITKQIENKTLGDPNGRVKLQLTLNAAADAPAALNVIAQVLDDADGVLADPKPAVFVDALTPGGAVDFVAYAYVHSPRDAYRVRSGLYVQIIQALGQADIAFAGADGQTVVLQPGTELVRLIDKAQGGA